jgi:hypothetical protein
VTTACRWNINGRRYRRRIDCRLERRRLERNRLERKGTGWRGTGWRGTAADNIYGFGNKDALSDSYWLLEDALSDSICRLNEASML